jgi:hypothetical protein
MSTHGIPFQPGNKLGRGRPKGSRNKSARAAQRLLEEHAEPLMRKCIAMAYRGDMKAMGYCMERLLPVIKEPLVKVKLATVTTAAEVVTAMNVVLESIAGSRLSPADGQKIADILDRQRRGIETEGLEKRVHALESAPDEKSDSRRLHRVDPE